MEVDGTLFRTAKKVLDDLDPRTTNPNSYPVVLIPPEGKALRVNYGVAFLIIRLNHALQNDDRSQVLRLLAHLGMHDVRGILDAAYALLDLSTRGPR